ncbi:MAG: ADP-glyceromanno-heptose 6-epimerase, partial [Acidobacteriales bacterium]|nr:ADP-glyceromanno-heptose 6-epimerase [Terriglobales bacterium]
LQYEDLLSPEVLTKFVEEKKFRDAVAIIHLGACSATTERNADYLLENNYRYTRRLCEFSLNHDVRFIYASSAATYGDGSMGYSDDDIVTPMLKPLNMYGYSKHMFDLWGLKNRLFDRIVGLKYFNVFGPYEDHKENMKSVVAKSYAQIHAEGKVQLFKSYDARYADGEQMRDFVYVKDAVAVTLSFLEQGSTSGLFNCGSGKARTWKDLVTAVFQAMEMPVQIEFIEMPDGLRGKYQYFTEARMEKLRQAGYSAEFYSLEDAVKDYVNTYLKKVDR